MIFLIVFGLTACENRDLQKTKVENSNAYSETRGDDVDNCPDPTPYEGCGSIQTKTTTLIIGGCDFQVTYGLLVCPSGISIFNIDWDYGNNQNCGAFKYYFKSLEVAGNYELINSTMNAIHARMATMIEDAELLALDYEKYQCSENPFNFSSTVIASTCVNVCAFDDGKGGTELRQKECGTECCTKYTAFCYNGSVLMTNPPQYNSPQPCNATSNCPGLGSSCSGGCSRIYPKKTDVAI